MANNVLRINGEISSYTVWRVNQFLGDNKGKPVTVRMASPGGDVASAVQISHAFADHGDTYSRLVQRFGRDMALRCQDYQDVFRLYALCALFVEGGVLLAEHEC